MKKELTRAGAYWLLQWRGPGAAVTTDSGRDDMLLSIEGQPDVRIPRKYWRWLAGALVESADKKDWDEL